MTVTRFFHRQSIILGLFLKVISVNCTVLTCCYYVLVKLFSFKLVSGDCNPVEVRNRNMMGNLKVMDPIFDWGT